MWLFLAFLAVPLIEIALFIQVGGAIGLFPTLGIVILTAIAGTWLVKSQGVQALNRLRQSLDTFQNPTTPLADGAMILFAGALLLTPGFFTDAVGFLLLAPQTRAIIRGWLAARIKIQTFGDKPGSPPRNETVIDADYEDVTPGQSGWTRH